MSRDQAKVRGLHVMVAFQGYASFTRDFRVPEMEAWFASLYITRVSFPKELAIGGLGMSCRNHSNSYNLPARVSDAGRG